VQPGDVVADRFVIERLIGSGGMGTVFGATDRVARRPVAVKVLDLASDDAMERLRGEAVVLAGLSHPGIVRYIVHGETPERRPFLAMELLEGTDLAARLSRGPLSVEESITLVRHKGPARTRALTQTGALLGTVGYMAPEQAMGWRDVDARADVFALDCVLFECLTGHPAFHGDHVVAILALSHEAPRPRAHPRPRSRVAR
jgi:serine/threonine protein kinase